METEHPVDAATAVPQIPGFLWALPAQNSSIGHPGRTGPAAQVQEVGTGEEGGSGQIEGEAGAHGAPNSGQAVRWEEGEAVPGALWRLGGGAEDCLC